MKKTVSMDIIDTDKVSENGTQRKLSMSIQLSHPWEYEGGELQFAPWGVGTPNMKKITFEDFLPRGSTYSFPVHDTTSSYTNYPRHTKIASMWWHHRGHN